MRGRGIKKNSTEGRGIERMIMKERVKGKVRKGRGIKRKETGGRGQRRSGVEEE